jgi:hypothetical protein
MKLVELLNFRQRVVSGTGVAGQLLASRVMGYMALVA